MSNFTATGSGAGAHGDTVQRDIKCALLQAPVPSRSAPGVKQATPRSSRIATVLAKIISSCKDFTVQRENGGRIGTSSSRAALRASLKPAA